VARIIPPERRCIRFINWPEQDRLAFEAALQAARGRFSRRGYAATLRPASIRKARDGYGRWLGFLTFTNDLDPVCNPAARLTDQRLDSYLAFLMGLGNADATTLGRFTELRMAMRIMGTSSDHSHILERDGRRLTGMLEFRQRPLVVYDPGMLYDWGIELMEGALLARKSVRRRTQLRTGLMVALEAVQALRLGNLLGLEVGRTLLREDDGRWRICFTANEVKNHKPLDVHWPDPLVPWLERYLAVERRELLGPRESDALWISHSGKPLEEEGVSWSLATYSEARFGREGRFRSHRFRHCLATTAPILMPDRPAIAATVLNVGAEVVAENYDRGANVMAARSFHRTIEMLRDGTKLIAEKAFKRRGRAGTVSATKGSTE